MAQQSTQSTDWCFTLNVDGEAMMVELWKRIRDVVENSNKFVYCRMQMEKGKEGGNLHVQGFLVCKTRTRWSTLSRLFGIDRFHWELRKGTRVQADEYCRKLDTRVMELEERECETEFQWGELPVPKQRGRQSATEQILEEIRDRIETTGKMPPTSEIPASILFSPYYSKMVQYAGNFVSYLEMKKRMHQALVLYGASGVGKSYAAVEIAQEVFGVDKILKITVTDHSRLWFPDASNKPDARCLIIDELQWGTVAQDQFKALLSGDMVYLEVKGSNRINTFEQIIITTNDDPKKWGAKKTLMADGTWDVDTGAPALNFNDHYIATQRRFKALNCTTVDGENLEEKRHNIRCWLRAELEWAMPAQAAAIQEEDRLIGEGACSQRAGFLFDVEELEKEAEEEAWTPRLEEHEEEEDDGRLRRTEATWHLNSNDENN